MLTHDLKCTNCNDFRSDVWMERGETKDGVHVQPCIHCGGTVKVYYGNWGHDFLFNEGKGDSRTDKKGFIRRFGVMDDPLAKLEIGMHKRPQDKGMQTFTEDQVMTYRERLAVEGDSPKLREKILETRQKNIASGL
jgi:hypothetical protein